MTTDLANHRDRAGRMQIFFNENATKIQPLADIWAEKAAFDDWIDRFDIAAQAQANPTTGLAAQKKAALDAAAKITCKWGIRCHVKAHADGQFNLETLLNHRPYEIKALEDKRGLTLLKDMAAGLTDNAASFTAQGLTPAVLGDIDGAINSYEKIINDPQYAIKDRKTDTEEMVHTMAEADVALGNAVALTEAEFFDTDPELVNTMLNENRLDNTGHRFNSIEGEIMKSGEPAKGYIVGIQGTDKQAAADLLGHYRIKGLKVGLCEVELRDKSGVVLQSKVVQVKRGVTLKMDWVV